MWRQLSAAAMLFAAEAACGAAYADQSVEQITVTAAKFPEAVGSAAFSTVNLSGEQLTISDRLDDALEQVPGLSLFRRTVSVSANVTTEGVSLRSIAPSGASRALVMLDGVPLNDPFGGWVVWTALPYEDIGGAEIVRGAGAGPYGAGALTGTILLTERSDSEGQIDAQGGTLDSLRIGASYGGSVDDIDLFGSASFERSNGWVPVQSPDRGGADDHVWFDGGSGSLRAETQIGDVLTSARIGYYSEGRGAGVVGAMSAADGLIGSLTFAQSPDAGGIGWRVQGWTIRSGFSNTSVSVAPGRGSTTPANDQFATPALGIGLNAALLGASGDFRWEAGTDFRDDAGESNELFRFSGTDFLMSRRSGGRFIVGGVYGEGAWDLGPWLLTLGAREDYWATSQGHLIERDRTTGDITNLQDYPGRHGFVPTARGGVRHDLGDGEYLRLAGYIGFRAPSLNELYRPFRVGNDVTQANANLRPEDLYGVEAGWGGVWESFHWDTTAFWNQLHNAVANVTIGQVLCGPVPCGVLRQRQNAGDINAYGFEGQVIEAVNDRINLWSALSATHAEFTSGQLDGLRPAQAPRVTITGGATWRPIDPLTLEAQLHWEGLRFEDDVNTLKLAPALVVDLRGSYALTDRLSATAAVDNVTGADVATAATRDAELGTVFSYGQPRVFWIGLSYTK
jgi:vitamin B12 transporter